MLVKRKLSEIPKGSTVYYLNTPFKCKGCVANQALLSSPDGKVRVILPADTELDYKSNMETLANKIQDEMEEYESWLADRLDRKNAQTSLDSVRILQGHLVSWYVRRSIRTYFVHEAMCCDCDLDREIRNQKLLKIEKLLDKLYEACRDIDINMELAIPNVIKAAIKDVLEEECAND